MVHAVHFLFAHRQIAIVSTTSRLQWSVRKPVRRQRRTILFRQSMVNIVLEACRVEGRERRPCPEAPGCIFSAVKVRFPSLGKRGQGQVALNQMLVITAGAPSKSEARRHWLAMQ